MYISVGKTIFKKTRQKIIEILRLKYVLHTRLTFLFSTATIQNFSYLFNNYVRELL